jgi:hypothetical protein
MQSPPTHMRLFRHLIRPARGGAAGVVIVFALLLALCAQAGLMGIPLALLLTSWFFKYAYILFDHTARGFDEPPVLDIQMMNPIDEQRPLGQLAILGLIYALISLAESQFGALAATVIAVISGLLLPASVAELGLEGNLLKAINPVAWLRIVLGLGPLYALVLLVVAAYVTGLILVWKLDLWLSVEIAIGMFAVLSIFSFLGGTLFERRHELGLDTWASPEQTQELRRQEGRKQDDLIVMQAYGLMRASSHVKCWQTLNDWLTSRGNAPEDYRWLCERVASWDDPRYVTRLTQDRIERLLYMKRTGEALDALAQRFNLDAAFRPKSAADTLNLARLAVHGGKRGLGRALVADFAARFTGDPLISPANALARQLGAAP